MRNFLTATLSILFVSLFVGERRWRRGLGGGRLEVGILVDGRHRGEPREYSLEDVLLQDLSGEDRKVGPAVRPDSLRDVLVLKKRWEFVTAMSGGHWVVELFVPLKFFLPAL